MSVTLSPYAGAGWQFFDNNGDPLSGGKIESYRAGTTTPLQTYTTNAGTVAHTNPIVLDSAGRVPAEVWLLDGYSYKFILKDSNNVVIGTYDNISAAPTDASSVTWTPEYAIPAGSFAIGSTYTIASVGTTDFTAIGASSNMVGVTFTATGIGSGTGTARIVQTVQKKLRQVISVKDFGAVGDGVTDDSQAIRLAAAAAQGKSLFFPSGTYLMSFAPTGSLMIPVYSNTEYYGAGPSSVIRIKDGQTQTGFLDNTTMFYVSNVNNVSIHDLYLDGNRANITHFSESPPLIYVINGSYNITVDRNTVANPGGDCVIVGSAGAVSLGGEKVIITNNIAINPGRSCYVLTSARDVVIANNLGYDAFNSYVDIETDLAGTYVGNVTVTGNVFRSTSGVKGTGFAATGPGQQFSIVVTNNVFASTDYVASLGSAANDGIIFSNNAGSGAPSTGNKYLIEILGGLKNGQVCNNKLSAQASGVGGIWMRGPYRVNIEGNTIDGVSYASAIAVDDPYGLQPAIVRVCDNSIYNMASGVSSGISIASGISSVVSGNSVDVGTTSAAGIVCAADDAVVSNNFVSSSNNASHGLYVFASKVNLVNNKVVGFDNCVYLTSNSDYCKVLGNTLDGGNMGVYAYETDYTNISNNFITNSKNDGVQVANGAGNTIVHGNTITNSSKSGAGSYYGLALYQSNVTVTDNTITDTQVSKTQNYAIRGVGGTDYFTFMGNNLSGNGTGAFSNVGPTNYYPNITGTFATDMAKFNRLS